MATILEQQTTETRRVEPSYPRLERPARVIGGGSLIESLGGFATVIMAVLALIGVYPVALTSVMCLVLGAAFALGGGSVMSQFARFTSENYGVRVRLGTGMAIEFFGGVAGLVLGALALMGVYSVTLVSVAALIFGITLAAAGFGTYGLDFSLAVREGRLVESAGAVIGAVGAQAFAGGAVAVLGILALAGLNALVLNVVSLLAVAAAVMFSSTAMSARLLRSY
jgi:hypothetical protein